ncbi:hypothetical protein [Nitrincola sp. MINF-07-Sa-05]|uniref:hypothetical protein n=1 Tax=Nitrincola salilacus TaxID=3400273 RepID=UPI003917C712
MFDDEDPAVVVLTSSGSGNDVMLGTEEADIFVWNFGDQGTVDTPAVDTVVDFNMS